MIAVGPPAPALRTARALTYGLAAAGVANQLSALANDAALTSPWPALLGALLGAALPVGADPSPRPAASLWVKLTLGLLAAVAAASIAHGAIATPSRHWDGAATWELRALVLAADPSLRQPFFTDPAVFSPCRDYPLLQPTLLAAFGVGPGRLLFPILWLGLLAAVHSGLRALNAPGWLPAAAAVAAGMVPRIAAPSLGGADSGYADLMCTFAVTAVAAAALRRDVAWLTAAATALVLTKPEGLIYAGLAVAALWWSAPRRLLVAATAGWLGAAALLLPVSQRLGDPDAPSAGWWLWPGLLALGVALIATHVARARLPRATVPLALAGLGLSVALAIPLAASASGLATGTFGQYLDDLGRPLERLERLPRILLGALEHGVLRGKFGLTWLAVPVLIWIGLRRDTARLAPLATFLGLCILAVLAPFLLGPEPDLGHHLRSSMGRLLSHHVGTAWLCIGVGAAAWIAAAERRGADGGSSVSQPPVSASDPGTSRRSPPPPAPVPPR